MPHVSNRPSPFSRLERAIKDRKMLLPNMRRPFNGPSSIDVANNSVRLIVIVPKLEQSSRHSLVNDLNHASANKLLEFHQCEVRFHTGCRTIHHETYCAGGG